MKTSTMVLFATAIVPLTVSLTLANPAMLPKHPGYPMDKAVDPISGQSLANDPGQGNATGNKALMEAAASDDSHVMQGLALTPNEQEVRDKLNATTAPSNKEQPKKKER